MPVLPGREAGAAQPVLGVDDPLARRPRPEARSVARRAIVPARRRRTPSGSCRSGDRSRRRPPAAPGPCPNSCAPRLLASLTSGANTPIETRGSVAMLRSFGVPSRQVNTTVRSRCGVPHRCGQRAVRAGRRHDAHVLRRQQVEDPLLQLRPRERRGRSRTHQPRDGLRRGELVGMVGHRGGFSVRSRSVASRNLACRDDRRVAGSVARGSSARRRAPCAVASIVRRVGGAREAEGFRCG